MSLEDIREKKTSKGVYVVIGLLLVGMAGFGTQQFGAGSGSSTAAALSLGNKEISQEQFSRMLSNNRQNYPDIEEATIEEITLSQSRESLALDNYLQQYPLAASNRVVDNYIRNNPSFHENGEFSEAVFRRWIAVEPQVYRRAISNDLSKEAFQRALSETGVVSQAEVMPYLEHQNLSRDILVAKLARGAFVNTADAAEIQAFYDANKASYQTDEQISIDYIELNPETIAAETAVSDEELAIATQPPRRVNYYLFADEKSANDAAEKVNAGNDMASLKADIAEQIDDQGEVGEITPIADEESLIPQSAIDAIFDLQSVGQVTAPINVDGNVYLFEWTGEPKAPLSEDEKRAAKTALQEEKAAPKIAALNEKLNQAVFEQQSPDLESISQATGLPVKHSERQAINSGKGILAVQELVEAIQNGDKTLGKLHDPVTVDDRVIIYRLTEVKAPQQKPLDSVKAEVEQAVIAEKTDTQQNEAAEQLIAQAKTDGFATAAKAADYPTQAYADFNGQVADGGVLDPIGALFIMQQAPVLGDDKAQQVKSMSGDIYVYVNTDVRLGEGDGNTEAQKSLTESLSGRLGQLEFSSFIRSITSRADIKMRRGLLQSHSQPHLANE